MFDVMFDVTDKDAGPSGNGAATEEEQKPWFRIDMEDVATYAIAIGISYAIRA